MKTLTYFVSCALCCALLTQAALAAPPVFSDPSPVQDIVPVPANVPEPAKEEILPPAFLTDRGFTKGVMFYTDFPKIPDIVSYANLYGKAAYIMYPTMEERFYYYENPEQGYIYRSGVYDFLNVPESALYAYGEYLSSIGFQRGDSIVQEGFEEYYKVVQEELLYAPDFKPIENGVFIMSNGFPEFIWLLVGRARNIDLQGNPADCAEFRLYSLSSVPRDSLNLAEFVSGDVSSISPRLINNNKVSTGVTVYATLPSGYVYVVPPPNTLNVSPELPPDNAYNVPEESGSSLVSPALPPDGSYNMPRESDASLNVVSEFTRKLNERLKNDSPKE
ncbi:MAG: hypothetical protein LBS62_08735 [Clostridiales bacterium]|nr:hypothetical protein [Clostridiales bacterium]